MVILFFISYFSKRFYHRFCKCIFFSNSHIKNPNLPKGPPLFGTPWTGLMWPNLSLAGRQFTLWIYSAWVQAAHSWLPAAQWPGTATTLPGTQKQPGAQFGRFCWCGLLLFCHAVLSTRATWPPFSISSAASGPWGAGPRNVSLCSSPITWPKAFERRETHCGLQQERKIHHPFHHGKSWTWLTFQPFHPFTI